MADNPLRRLEALGQSICLDAFRRAMPTSGGLKRLIDGDGLSKAIAGSHDYDAAVQALARQAKPPREIYEALAWRTCATPPTCSTRPTTAPAARTGSSRWRSRPASPTTPRPPWKKRAGCGRRWPPAPDEE